METQMTKGKRWMILINVCISIFMATLDGSIVNIALPVISGELNANISSVQWVVTSYLLTISVLLLIWGKISDIYGRRNLFGVGFIIFTVGSALCGMSSSLGMLVFSRVVQAIGAASMMALSQGIVTSTFPPQERGKALGITGTVVAIGSLVGPSLGGLLVHAAGWQSIFYINIPIGILGTVLTFLIIPKEQEKKGFESFDYNGSFMYVIALSLLFMALLFLQEGTITLMAFLPMIITGLVLLGVFIKYEGKTNNALLNLNLFKNKVFSIGVASAYLSFVAIFCITLFMPFYLQNVLKLDTRAAGVLLSFYPITTAIVAPLSGWLSDRVTYRPLTVTGLTISAISLAALATLGPNEPHIKIALMMAAVGLGGGLFQSPNNSSVMGAVPREMLGIAGGINALFRNLGMVSGITLSVMLFSFTTRMNINNLGGDANTFDTSLFLKGFRIVLITASLTCVAAMLLSLSRALGKRADSVSVNPLPRIKPDSK